jgi:transposase
VEEKYVGIDIHRDYGVVCVQDPKGKTLDEFRFGNNIKGINKVKEKLGNNNSHIAIESTGNMWIVLWDKLGEIKSDLHLVHPLKTKAIASNKSRRLRWMLIQCAHASIRTNSKINQFYSKIAKRRGENKAVVAVARKLVKIIYAVLSSRNPSLYGDPEKTERKIKKMRRIAEKVV